MVGLEIGVEYIALEKMNLKSGIQYLLNGRYYNDDEFRLYTCDWNNDGDIYEDYGVYMKNLNTGYKDFISCLEFTSSMYKYEEYFDNEIYSNKSTGNLVKIIFDIVLHNEKYLIVRSIYNTEEDKIISTDEFNKSYGQASDEEMLKTIDFINDERFRCAFVHLKYDINPKCTWAKQYDYDVINNWINNKGIKNVINGLILDNNVNLKSKIKK